MGRGTTCPTGKGMAKAIGLGALEFIAGNSFQSIKKIEHLESPLLIIHGDKDEVVPYEMGLELFEKYSGKKTFVTIPNGDHNGLQNSKPEMYWGAIKDFIRELP